MVLKGPLTIWCRLTSYKVQRLINILKNNCICNLISSISNPFPGPGYSYLEFLSKISKFLQFTSKLISILFIPNFHIPNFSPYCATDQADWYGGIMSYIFYPRVFDFNAFRWPSLDFPFPFLFRIRFLREGDRRVC